MLELDRNNEIGKIDFKGLILPFYLPSGFAFLSLGIILPLIPLYAKNLGMNVMGISYIVGLYGLGNMLFNIPAGFLLSRFNKKIIMLTALFFEAVFIFLSSITSNHFIFGLNIFLLGSARTTFLTARLSYIRLIVPPQGRGRVLAVIGGENRLGSFIGPIVGGLIVDNFGYRWAFILCALFFLASLFFVLFNLPSESESKEEYGEKRNTLISVKLIFKENKKRFLTAGISIIMLQLLRMSRQVLIPLIGDSIGLNVTQIGYVFGAAFFVELIIFYPAGSIMDRWGRKVIAIPALFFFSLGIGIMPFSFGFYSLMLTALVTGLGNGLSSGLNMTLSTDFAPGIKPSEFIGVWRFYVDMGTFGGPFIVGLIAGTMSLGAASMTIALLGGIGTIIMWLFVPETLEK